MGGKNLDDVADWEARLAADIANREHLLSPEFCCGEVEIGNGPCEGCPFGPEKAV